MHPTLQHLSKLEQRKLWRRAGDLHQALQFWTYIVPGLVLLVLLITTDIIGPRFRHQEFHLLAITLCIILAFGTYAILHQLWYRRCTYTLQQIMWRKKIRPAFCFKCNYDLRASEDDTCPECDETIALPIETA